MTATRIWRLLRTSLTTMSQSTSAPGTAPFQRGEHSLSRAGLPPTRSRSETSTTTATRIWLWRTANFSPVVQVVSILRGNGSGTFARSPQSHLCLRDSPIRSPSRRLRRRWGRRPRYREPRCRQGLDPAWGRQRQLRARGAGLRSPGRPAFGRGRRLQQRRPRGPGDGQLGSDNVTVRLGTGDGSFGASAAGSPFAADRSGLRRVRRLRLRRQRGPGDGEPRRRQCRRPSRRRRRGLRDSVGDSPFAVGDGPPSLQPATSTATATRTSLRRTSAPTTSPSASAQAPRRRRQPARERRRRGSRRCPHL